MSIFKEYIQGDIKNNKKNYHATRMTIFLAVVILSTFVFGVSSFFKSFLDTPDSMGGSHFKIISTIPNEDAKDLASNRHIKKIGFQNTRELEIRFGSKEKTKLYKMDDNAVTTMSFSLKEGELPKDGEVMISDNMSREIGKSLGANIEIEGNTYAISGTYYDTGHEDQDFYNIYLNVEQSTLLDSKEGLSAFIWYKNIYRTYSLSEKIMEHLEVENIDFNYNNLYLDRLFVINPAMGLFEYYMNHILIFVLFIVLIILFYVIIVNLFQVQESKSIVEYSRLKSVGATNRDIDKIIRLKTLYISQLPIVLGIFSSLGLVKALFMIINGVEKYFSGVEDTYATYWHWDLKVNIKLVLFVYLLSFLIIYLGTRKPIGRLKKNAILDGLKGNIKGKSYKKYDLIYRGNIEKDLSKQFYKNSKYSFRFTGITLKLGFLLMIFIMLSFTYYTMDIKYNHMSKYETYDIQAEYATLEPLNENLMKDIRALEIEDLINFRKTTVNLDLDEDYISDVYKNSGSLRKFKEEITSLDNMTVELFGIEDERFKELAMKKGLNLDVVGHKVMLLNTMGNDFNMPVSKMKNIKFLEDDINELSLSEYGRLNIINTKGHEFTLNIENKVNTPLFDYPITTSFLNIYMPKSQYMALINKFEKFGDIDQYEYISIKTDHIEEVQEKLDTMSLEYFNGNDYFRESRLDEKKLEYKRNIMGSVLATFLSLFFIVVGFSNSYCSFYNLFLKRKDEFLLYKSIGMDEKLLARILNQEKRKILFSFIYSMPFIVLGAAYIMSKIFTIFRPLDFLLNLNDLFILVILGYVFIIYISISKIYVSVK